MKVKKFKFSDKTFGELIGRKINDVLMNKEKTILKFITDDDKSIFYHADADCCSESWFTNFQNGSNLRYEIKNVSMTDGFPSPPTRQEVDEIRHCSIDGFTFDLINSSNGYYCGWVSCIGDTLEGKTWINGKTKFKSVLSK